MPKPLPKAVQAQMERAEALQNEFVQKTKEAQESKAEDQNNIQEPPTAVQDNDVQVPPAVQETPTVTDDDGVDWKQKYMVLQGKYNKEVKGADQELLNTLRAQNQNLSQENSRLSRTVSDMDIKLKALEARMSTKAAVTTSQAAQTSNDSMEFVENLGSLSAEEKKILEAEGFDKKTVGVFGRLVELFVEKRLAGLSQKVETVQATAHQSAEEVFWQRFQDAVPDWRTINESDGFNKWIEQKAPYQNATLKEVLLQARDDLDLGSCTQIFLDYMDYAKANSTNANIPEPPKTNPEDLVEPDAAVSDATSNVAEHGNNPNKKIYRMSDYKKFMRERQKGMWRGREDEATRIDALYTKAAAEGRMTD